MDVGVCARGDVQRGADSEPLVHEASRDAKQQQEGTHLARDRVKQGVDHRLREPALLVLVHLHDLPPVRRDLGQMQALGEVHEVEDVLLEAGPAEADGRAQELGADTRVESDRVRDLVDVRARRLADRGERVHGRDALGEHRVRRELRQLG